jgi:alkanesulfonate monooxygenase SsuD/methylene tetrahydromethanopterin reductase-like flavin-dependent oxidoreductase (luciferase family)
MTASLQYLSGNRLYLGIGAGWKEDEYQAYGYEFPPAGRRVDQLDEALHIIRALWTESPATFTGQHYRINGAWCEPKPESIPPIMIGGKRPRMLRRAHAKSGHMAIKG